MSYPTRIALFTRYADGSVEITHLAATNAMGMIETRLTEAEAEGLEEYLADSKAALPRVQKEVLAGVHDAQRAESKTSEPTRAERDREALEVAGHDVPVETKDEIRQREDQAKAEAKAEQERAKVASH